MDKFMSRLRIWNARGIEFSKNEPVELEKFQGGEGFVSAYERIQRFSREIEIIKIPLVARAPRRNLHDYARWHRWRKKCSVPGWKWIRWPGPAIYFANAAVTNPFGDARLLRTKKDAPNSGETREREKRKVSLLSAPTKCISRAVRRSSFCFGNVSRISWSQRINTASLEARFQRWTS